MTSAAVQPATFTTARRVFHGRIAELDGIRGLAILAVLFYHLFSYTMFHRSWAGVAHLAMKVTENWSHGVDLFFVLSGFLITGILLDTRSDCHYFRNFYARRALRILPLYYAVLVLILICYRGSGSYVLLSFFHLSNVAPIIGITMFNGAMWSLSVEEHFYLCWAPIIRLFRPRTVAYFAAGLCLAEPVVRGFARAVGVNVFPYSWFRLDGVAAGALLACFVRSSWYSSRHAKRLAMALAASGILMEIAGSPFGIRQHQTVFGAALEYPPVDMMAAGLVLWGAAFSGYAQTGILRSRLLRVCGDLSYCLYLIHCIVMDVYDKVLIRLHLPPALTDFRSVVVRATIVLAASLLVATVSRVFLEQPAMRAKRFFESSTH